MPWRSFRQLTDEDLTALFTCLQSLPPVHPGPVPFDQVNHQRTPAVLTDTHIISR